jgi:hypothetical protein
VFSRRFLLPWQISFDTKASNAVFIDSTRSRGTAWNIFVFEQVIILRCVKILRLACRKFFAHSLREKFFCGESFGGCTKMVQTVSSR